ncbi:hypothetical protein BDM02DRAFT_3115857 [Thelephora ganbajun]|uniref:Uncharacterized protein n=1 Tax=Thelephora ganbajun TaxID=370292 RepID=A0ACB6ZFI9_THEGA|nr:hypothetical protein BDM02DRAFT_3115857 [Thelephora ganbajun]
MAMALTGTALGPPMSAPAHVSVLYTPDSSLSWDSIPSDMLLEVASYMRDDRYALLSLTRVCSYWRQVLVECPLNWTQISTKYPTKLLKLWLQRSKSVPIDAEICHLPPELIPLLRPKNISFRSLRCTLNKKNLLKLFEGLTKVSPNLERLELYRRSADQRSQIRLKIISGSMPSLKDLRLASIDLTPEILRLRHLVNLELAHPFPSLTAVLDLIVSNPLLEMITLSVRCAGKTDPRPNGAVMIPRLRSLTFGFYSPVPLFHRLSIPRGATVSFSLWADAEECETILPDSLEHLHNLSEVKNLYVQHRSGYWIKASGPSGEVKFEGKNDPDLELQKLPLQFVERFRYAEIRECSEAFSKEAYPGWISKVFGRSRNLKTLVIDSCKLATMKYIFRLLSPQHNRAPGAPLRRESLPCPALSTIILEVPHDGSWNDWAVPFIQMLRDRAAVGSRLQKVRIVSNPRVQIPRPGEEKRKQMAKLVRWVEVKYFWYKDGAVDERRARELFEWQHDKEGFSKDDIRVTSD